MRKITLLIILIITSIQLAPGQGLYSPGSPADDGKFAASTKQVNQFLEGLMLKKAKMAKNGITPLTENIEIETFAKALSIYFSITKPQV